MEQRYNKKREGVPLPLRMSIDIASGLHCLHANYFYHRYAILTSQDYGPVYKERGLARGLKIAGVYEQISPEGLPYQRVNVFLT